MGCPRHRCCEWSGRHLGNRSQIILEATVTKPTHHPHSSAQTHSEGDSPQQRLSGCLIRLCWMFFGNVALVLLATFIAKNRETLFSLADVAFWVIAAGLISARYVDIKRLKGETVSGHEAATMRHWRRYAFLVVTICSVLWVLAHIAAHVWR